MFRAFCLLLIFTLLSQQSALTAQLVVPEVQSGSTSPIPVVETHNLQKKSPLPARLISAKVVKHDSIIFVGDVLLARNVEFLMRTRSPDYPFKGLNFLETSNNPAVVGNFEAAVPREHSPTPIRQIDFSVATWTLPYAAEAGFTHFSLANNHSYDFGPVDFDHTEQVLEGSFSVFGNPGEISDESVSIISLKNTRIALIAVNALDSFDKLELKIVMDKAMQSTDKQIVYVHWGEEYDSRHSTEQTELAEFFVDLGADLVVGHHPHVVQNIDLINGVPVFYSLGNYVFDQYFSRQVQEGLVLVLSDTSEIGVALLPVSSHTTLSQPRALSAEDHVEFLLELAERSHDDLSDYISEGYIPLSAGLETSEKVAMMLHTNHYVQ